jgi:phage gpG-like protein
MSKAIKFDAAGVQTIVAAIGKPIKNTTQFFTDLGAMIDRDTQLTFGLSGARSGMPKWQPISAKLFGKRRPGTDGAKSRRYDEASKPLLASGLFQKSFRVTRVSNGYMKFETVHELGGKIGAKPRREVLFITDEDKRNYSRLFRNFIDKGIRV